MPRFMFLLFLIFAFVYSHEHDPPHWKYSQEANADSHSHHHEHHHHDHDHHDHHEPHHETYSQTISIDGNNNTTWLYAILATLAISILPIFILIAFPIENTSAHQHKLRVLLSFASGGLLGDAFLHLIPHAIMPHSHTGAGHSHEIGGGHPKHHTQVGVMVVLGIMVFLITEKLVRYFNNESHSHDHNTTDKKKTKPKAKKPEIEISGYLNLAADFLHNFTDGLALGASFLISHNIGMITAITIFIHEIPHEIGDFAILIKSGCSKWKAIFFQLLTAVGALCGTLFSLSAGGETGTGTGWILPFTAGGFIYIATVSIIPELLAESKVWQTFKEILALIFGVSLMVLIGQFE